MPARAEKTEETRPGNKIQRKVRHPGLSGHRLPCKRQPKHSEVDEKTKRVLLFVQTYDPIKIRQACQALGFRTEAASRFEKGVESEGVIPAIKRAMTMFEKNCGAQVASKLTDLYPKPPKSIKVSLSQDKLNRLMGIEVKLSEAKKILEGKLKNCL